jgi:hypothetical protein
MDLLTYDQIKTKIQRDLDLETEDFIQADELLGYVNEAIDECEAEIHKLGMEDYYFLTRGFISLVTNQEEYDLPSDIYANKIRRIMYENGNVIFPVRRLRKDQFELYAIYKQYPPPSNFYCYMVINPTAGAKPKILLVPKARETSASVCRIWYIRNANKMVNTASVCDIPEFASFIIKFAKFKCLQKEGNPQQDSAKQELEEQRKLMQETLENMIPDDDSKIPADFSTYTEMS